MTFFDGRSSPVAEAFLLLEISAFGVSTFDGIVKEYSVLARMRDRSGECMLRGNRTGS